jgi:hypothetical protein
MIIWHDINSLDNMENPAKACQNYFASGWFNGRIRNAKTLCKQTDPTPS